ncbi:MAG: helix-turn-helix domain-containing protein [Bacteroidia bacterium]|nr:helix-turn-helix domain-containing protein [Bacteroidia bacterium]
MQNLIKIQKPSKEDQLTAIESYNALAATLAKLNSTVPEIGIEETNDKIKIPISALQLFAKILQAMSEGKPISIVPIATEMTTQAAAEFLGCSRPHLVKLLVSGEIPFTMIGKHRRVKFEDVANYKNERKVRQEKLIIEIMNADEESGLYDS